ncbi:MAG: metal ABC transporter substrate-binding protein [Treponema sp.]|uniref:metal ABC transporter substrate-binding protein n=1 Tax=Treponema sp. TaxID=166 RepID=UPI002A90F632|nr:metal ABC transporter substrate-binding protein [Treponema sp.]MDY6398288.1 metal ABC transporter substrate-binding protein [Treponema sp.]
MKINKIFAVAGVLLALGCGSVFAKKAKAETNKLKVVTTIFPEYDWAREVIGENADNVELTLLLNNGVDLHSYSPSVKDIAKISEADIFVYVGGESDEWVDDVIKNAKNPNMKVINLVEVLGDRVKNEEIVEGMQHEHHHHDEHGHDDHDDDDHDEHEHHHHEEDEKDEHVWLSLRFAKTLCGAIADALCEKDAANAAVYQKNLASYTAKLDALDAKYTEMVKNSSKKVVVFGDRFPFRYLVEDYGLKYYAAFTGCSAESEASFKTIVFLSEKVNELGLQCVCQIETGNGKIAKTVISNSKNKKAKVVTFDSLQSTTAKQIKKGATYLGAMEKNLEVLKMALK